MAAKDLSELLGHSIRVFLRHVDLNSQSQSILKAHELLEALQSDFGVTSTDPVGKTAIDSENSTHAAHKEVWTLHLRGLQGEIRKLQNLPCQITFGDLHERIREVTGAKDQGCDVKLFLKGTVLQHSRAFVLNDMARCDGMELTYLLEPIGPPPNLLGLLDSKTTLVDPLTLETEYNTTYNQQRRTVQWAVEAAEAREARLIQLISPEGAMWNLSCLGSRPRLAGEEADARCSLNLTKEARQ